jgi:hypothetical protein
MCGWTPARARSGNSMAVNSCLGKSDKLGQAMTGFSERYADQNERDYREFIAAIKSGRLPVIEGV